MKDRKKIENDLIVDILHLIRITNEDNPEVCLKCELLTQEDDFSEIGFMTTFKVLTSSEKGKIKDIFTEESKVGICNNSKEIIGTVMSVEKDTIVLSAHKSFKKGTYNIRNLPNYINFRILECLNKFIEDKKDVKECIVERWIENIGKDLYSDGSKKKNKNTEASEKESSGNTISENMRSFNDKEQKLLNDIKERRKESEGSEKSKNETSMNVIEQEVHSCTEEDVKKSILHGLQNITLSNSVQYNTDNANQKEFDSNLSKTHKHFYNKDLNESQREVINQIFTKKSFKVIGPPGTGKTRTILEIILQILTMKKTVLVLGPSNISVDNIIELFVESHYYEENRPLFYRLGSSIKGLFKYNIRNLVKQQTNFMVKEKNEKANFRDSKFVEKKYTRDLEKNANVVFATLFSSLKITQYFDWVIIDEACQAGLVESFLAVHKSTNFILVGDPNQLCPITVSLYEKLNLKTFLLNKQYRMPKNLFDFSNLTFYAGKVSSYHEEKLNIIDNHNNIFIDTENSDFCEEDYEHSKLNRGEVEIVLKIIKYLDTDDIGVIAPYSAQVNYIKEKTNVEVATVDGFQGREKDYIILSLVRSNIDKNFGFLSNKKRLNVALTRAKKGIFIIGDSGNFRKSEIFSNFFKHLNNNALVLLPEELDDILV